MLTAAEFEVDLGDGVWDTVETFVALMRGINVGSTLGPAR